MKAFLYNLVKGGMRMALHLYFKEIKIQGYDQVPRHSPLLFLPNHQNALLDVLLIAVNCPRKPYFLTRSDVFKGKVLPSVFSFFQMIPIYRIRDGRESLGNNQAVFEKCQGLLGQGKALLLFPEANHNLQRRVRPLSKGFTRILFSALDKKPEQEIHLIPIGLNYQNALRFPDAALVNYAPPISSRPLYDPADMPNSVHGIKKAVSDALKQVTVHIEEGGYDGTIQDLHIKKSNFLNPTSVNRAVADPSFQPEKRKENNYVSKPVRFLFILLNLPPILIWRTFVKPKVWEPEFLGTLRFAYALAVMPMYYLLCLISLWWAWSFSGALGGVALLFCFNWVAVKLM